MKKILFFSISTVMLLSTNVISSGGRFGITTGNPWIGLKYSFSERVNTEIRTGIEPGIKVNSLRFGYNLLTKNIFIPYLSLEFGSITFNDAGFSGNGYLFAAMLGEEFYISRKISLGLDIGYSTINLQAAGYSVSGPEWIFNLGLNYYFVLLD